MNPLPALAAGAALVAGGFPALTTDGIGGVKPGASLADLRARWHLQLPAAVDAGGSEARALVPICAGPVRGVASLSGPSATPPVRFLRLDYAVFTAGVHTDTGIHVGSSLAELRRAYGRRLRGNQFERTVISPSVPHVAILFALEDARVKTIGFGRRGGVPVSSGLVADCPR